MDYQPRHSRRDQFSNLLLTNGIGLAYFFGSQKELGPRLLSGEDVQGAPESDLDLGVVLLEHPLDYWEGQRLRKQLEDDLAPLFAPVRLHLLLLEEENAHVQYAAIRGIQIYAVNEAFVTQYRRQVLTLYGDWHSWWP
jgi:predicted nucleotidyltransferase